MPPGASTTPGGRTGGGKLLMLLRMLGWTAGGALGASLALFLTNWAGAGLQDYLPRSLFTVTVQTGYVTYLLSPVVLALVLTVWIVHRWWRWWRRGERLLVAPKKPLLVLGLLLVASHALLMMQRARSQGSQVQHYTDGNSTFVSVSASSIDITAPDGTELRGTWEADLIGGVVTVTPDDASKGQADERMNPRDFSGFRENAINQTNRMLLELHGWPRERWPEGWSPR